MKIEPMKIKTSRGERMIGINYPTFVVAEMSGNHNQSLEKALKIIDAADSAGADAIKIQTYTPDTLTIDCDNDYFQIKNSSQWSNQTLYQLYQKAYTPWEWQEKLKKYAESKGLAFFSTPFDQTAVIFLENINVGLYKVASYEIVDIPLLKAIGRTKKPVILSRGLATEEEIRLAIKTLKENGTKNIILLHCINSYPAEVGDMNLKMITRLCLDFKVPVGISDHSLDKFIASLAVGLGACVVEKHLTLSRDETGVDSNFSLEPDEFRKMVDLIRKTELTLGNSDYRITENEKNNVIYRKSIFIIEDIKAGEKFDRNNLRCIRPGHGLEPKYYGEILGKTAKCNIERGTPLSWDLIFK